VAAAADNFLCFTNGLQKYLGFKFFNFFAQPFKPKLCEESEKKYEKILQTIFHERTWP
jgi:hypothetical protein